MQQHVHDSNFSFHENASVRTTALFCEKELKNCTPTDDIFHAFVTSQKQRCGFSPKGKKRMFGKVKS